MNAEKQALLWIRGTLATVLPFALLRLGGFDAPQAAAVAVSVGVAHAIHYNATQNSPAPVKSAA